MNSFFVHNQQTPWKLIPFIRKNSYRREQSKIAVLAINTSFILEETYCMSSIMRNALIKECKV